MNPLQCNEVRGPDFIRYDLPSITAFCRDLQARSRAMRRPCPFDCTRAIEGDMDLIPAAMASWARLQTIIPVVRRQIIPALAGSHPCVPDLLANRPEPMRRTAHRVRPAMSCRLFISTDTGDSNILEQGLLACALVMGLRNLMATELYIYYTNNDSPAHIINIRIPLAPLNLAQFSYAISNMNFVHLTYAYTNVTGYSVGWPNGCTDVTTLRRWLGAAPTDLVTLPAGVSSRNPRKWLEKAINDAQLNVQVNWPQGGPNDRTQKT